MKILLGIYLKAYSSHSDLPDPEITITGLSIGTAGETLVLTCIVGTAEHLIVEPTVMWFGISEENQNILHNGPNISKTLTFSPLLPSHGGHYICLTLIVISSINLTKSDRNEKEVVVQSRLFTFIYGCP